MPIIALAWIGRFFFHIANDPDTHSVRNTSKGKVSRSQNFLLILPLSILAIGWTSFVALKFVVEHVIYKALGLPTG